MIGVGGDPTAAAQTKSAVPENAIAVINGEVVPRAEFEEYFAQFARNRIYHVRTKEKLAALRRQALDQFIEERLLLQEANRRQIAGDAAAVSRQVAELEDRYAGGENWEVIKQRLPEIRQQLLEASQRKELAEKIRHVDEPNESELRRFYSENLDLFTLPERNRVSMILLRVDPGLPWSEWEAAEAKARELLDKLALGATFSELAKKYSNHKSAAEGGDLGLLHHGQLVEPVQVEVDKLEKGQVTPPVKVLEGYALFQLNERLTAEVQTFDSVRSRALALYLRERSQDQWARFVAEIKQTANVSVDRAANVAKDADTKPTVQ